MRRRALLSGLLLGGVAVLSGALTVARALEIPLEPDDGDEQPPGGEEGEEPLAPPAPEPHAPPPLPPGPEDDDEEDRPPTEPA